MKAIFIMSSERSGSNLLREMLNAHPAISAPPATQLPRWLYSNLHYYGDLQVDENFYRLIGDAVKIIKSHPVAWEIDYDVEAISQSVSSRSLWGVIATLYELQAASENKSCWASKDNNIFDYAYAIRCLLPEVKFLYLVRDGRDYVCSMRRAHKGHGHIFGLAAQWRQEQSACLKVMHTLKNIVHLIRYEDLLVETETSLRAICAFLELPYFSEMLDYYQQDSSKNMAAQSTFWENLQKPVIKSNFGKFISQLSASDLRLFEAIAGHELTILGYPRLTDVAVKDSAPFRRIWYWLVDRWMVYRRQNQAIEVDWRIKRKHVSREISRSSAAIVSLLPTLETLDYEEKS